MDRIYEVIAYEKFFNFVNNLKVGIHRIYISDFIEENILRKPKWKSYKIKIEIPEEIQKLGFFDKTEYIDKINRRRYKEIKEILRSSILEIKDFNFDGMEIDPVVIFGNHEIEWGLDIVKRDGFSKITTIKLSAEDSYKLNIDNTGIKINKYKKRN